MPKTNHTTSPSHIDSRLVNWVRQAAPYIHTFRGQTFVIALGANVPQAQKKQTLIHDIALLDAMGIRLVLVHSARSRIDAEMKSRGLKPRYHKGLRITDAQALECVKRATGTARIEIEALLSQGLPNTPLAGGFLRITGGNFITARPVGVIDGIDYQYTGVVRNVIGSEIRADLSQENLVLISPLAASPSGEIFNLTWEEVAREVACSINADKLIFFCAANGIKDGLHDTVSALTSQQAELLLQEKVKQAPEIRRILPCAIKASRCGVGKVHIIDRRLDGALLMELFTNEGCGTVLTREPLARIRQAHSGDISSLASLIAPMETDGSLVTRNREHIEQDIHCFSVLEHDGIIIGCAALIPHIEDDGKRQGELACLAVIPKHQQAGYGEQLLKHIESLARSVQIPNIFALTTRTAHWFKERGFKEVSSWHLPSSLPYNDKRGSKVFIKEVGKASAPGTQDILKGVGKQDAEQ